MEKSNKMKTIIVNCKEIEWDKDVITYGDILKILNIKSTSIYSINYLIKTGKSERLSGILDPDTSVEVRDRMIISCHYTGNA